MSNEILPVTAHVRLPMCCAVKFKVPGSWSSKGEEQFKKSIQRLAVELVDSALPQILEIKIDDPDLIDFAKTQGIENIAELEFESNGNLTVTDLISS